MSLPLSGQVEGLHGCPKGPDASVNGYVNAADGTYRADGTGFAELLSTTIEKDSQTGTASGAAADTYSGKVVSTGRPLDLAIRGQGYFVVSSGKEKLYTRTGGFGVDESGYLVDQITGYLVQRIGSAGESSGFQAVGDSGIGIRRNMTLPAQATSEIAVSGNLSAEAGIQTNNGGHVTDVDLTVYDRLGNKHVLSAAFVRAGPGNTWDMVLKSLDGDTGGAGFAKRRIRGIQFNDDGSYAGLDKSIGDAAEFVITFKNDRASRQTIRIVLGTEQHMDGLTQFSGSFTAAARGQNGYPAGTLDNISVDRAGIVTGTFSNGARKEIAALQIALFPNAGSMERYKGYYRASAASGQATITEAMQAGAGSIYAGALEKSSAEVINEFVNIMQANSGFVTDGPGRRAVNDVLRQLSNFIR